MESVLHDIQELQKIADDLAVGAAADRVRYEEDSELYLVRIEAFILDNCHANYDYLTTKLMEVRACMGYLLRAGQGVDPERYQALVRRGLDGIYRSIKHPAVGDAEEGAE